MHNVASRVLKKGVNRITQRFSSAHKAVDLGRVHATGETVVAHSDGRVVFCQTGQVNAKGSRGNKSYGNCVKLDHGDGYSTLYAHLKDVAVCYGQSVKRGQTLGTMGNTGNSYGVHLHVEVRKHNVHVDPTPYLENDLPLAPHITYQVYTTRWWPWVTNYHERGADGYAGVVGRAFSRLRAKSSRGTLRYRLHTESGWTAWAQDGADCGRKGVAADAVQMVLEGAHGYEVCYRVSPCVNGGWYGWCTGLSDKTGDGYAGVFGKAADCLQAYAVRKG